MVVQGIPSFSQKDVIDSSHDFTTFNWNSGIFWHGPDYGWNYNIDAIQVQRTLGGMQ